MQRLCTEPSGRGPGEWSRGRFRRVLASPRRRLMWLSLRVRQPRCPVCSSGPLTEREISDLQNADGSRPPASQASKLKKPAYSIDTIASSPGSSSSREVLTILDSDEEEEEEQKLKPGNGKLETKAKIQEITLSDSDDDQQDSDSSDEFMPSPEKSTYPAASDDDDEGSGRLAGSSDDEALKPAKSRNALAARGDFRSSTKLEALVRSLQEAKAKDPKLKAVVFSQVSLSLVPLPRVSSHLLPCP